MNGVVNQCYMSSSLHDTVLIYQTIVIAVIVIVIFITVYKHYH